MSELVEVNGLVFKRTKFKEADLLAKIMTKELGIVTVIARGALKPKSKLGAGVLTFSDGKYVIVTNKRGISTLRTYKAVKQYDLLYSDLKRNAYAAYLFDLLDHAFVEYQVLGEYYDLLKFAVKRLNAGADPEIITQMVQLKMLKAYGVAPHLADCVICGRKQGIFDYSLTYGGVLCQQHFHQDPHRLHLEAKTTALIRTLGLLPYQRLGETQIDPKLTEASRKAIDRIYRETVDLNLKTQKFLEELRSLDGH